MTSSTDGTKYTPYGATHYYFLILNPLVPLLFLNAEISDPRIRPLCTTCLSEILCSHADIENQTRVQVRSEK
jgi:hypothetical protein